MLCLGAMYVNGSLDYESCQEYYLSIDGNRKGKPLLSDTTTVIINVTDVNDNPPMFGHSVHAAEVSEDAPLGEMLLKVSGKTKPLQFYCRQIVVRQTHMKETALEMKHW